MKRLFFTICFIICSLWHFNADARVQSIVAGNPTLPEKDVNIQVSPNDFPKFNTKEDMRRYLKKRLNEAARTVVDKNTASSSMSGVSIIHSPEYYDAKKEKEKPFFQKVYEKALASLNQEESSSSQNIDHTDEYTDRQIVEAATRFFTIIKPEEKKKLEEQIPTVALTLPSGRRILAPAREHIPYFLSYIDIQANGYIKVEDTMVLIANGKKFATPIERTFPKYAKNNQRIEFFLENVTVNGTKIPYTTEEIGNNIVIKPKYNQLLEPGIYTYRFNYLVNNKLIVNDDSVMLGWDLTGAPVNALITSANAIITLPTGHSFDNAFSIIGRENNYTNRRTNIFRFSGNSVAFSSNTPILNNEDVFLVTEMNKNIFIKDFNKNFSIFLINWGSIIYALIGLITILGSFILSLTSLKKEQKTNKYNPSYDGSLMRSILIGKYDRVSFMAQLLDLYRKNAIDITQSDNRVYIHKRSIDSSKLNKSERKALKMLFAKNRVDVEINTANNVILKKVYRVLAKNVMKKIKKYRIIHNIGYVLFSCAMLLLTEAFISFISTNFAQALIIMLSTTLLYAFYIWIMRHNFKHWYLMIPTKLFALISLAVIWIFSSIYIGGITSIMILAMVTIIFAFTHIFSEQNNFVNEAKNTIAKYKDYLQTNADAINLSRDFVNQQSSIFALDINEYFPQNVSNKNYYKLDIAEHVKQLLIGIV